jgi:hypothetical protein
MDNHEQKIKDEMRIYAIEYLVSCLWAMNAFQTDAPAAFWNKSRDQMIASARQKTFSGADAATSDLYSAELEAALTHLSSMVSSQIDHVLKAQGKS